MKLEFHHINYVSDDVERLHHFYIDVLGLDEMPIDNFPRPDETEDKGYSGKIRFATDGHMQMHLAERNLDVAFKHSETINPVERGHIAFRTDDIEAFKLMLDEKGKNMHLRTTWVLLVHGISTEFARTRLQEFHELDPSGLYAG